MLEVTALLVVVVSVGLRLAVVAVAEMIAVVEVAGIIVVVAELVEMVERVVCVGGAVTVNVVEAESLPGLPVALIV
jgi:hypothetical protein